MTHTHNLDHLVANVVTKVAVNFPVQIIEAISFYDKKKLVAACFWKDGSDQMQVIRTDELTVAPSIVYFEEEKSLTPTDICITGLDADENPFSLHLSLEFITGRFAA